MSIKTDFPHPIRVIEHTWITMSDGCKLAARIWLPADAESFHVTNRLDAYEGQTQMFAKTWSCTIPRDLV